ATTEATAAPTDDSAIQLFDIAIGDYKYGELTVDTETDQVSADANVGKESADKRVALVARNDRSSPCSIEIAHSIVNGDGQVHWKGTLSAAQIEWIHTYGDSAIFFVRIHHSLL
ncbi:MAG: hypothetical protein LUP95_06950, partial [Euryarchaeota archaeon]|nr:hypothetical protein [Euryarchaeota archaeon]